MILQANKKFIDTSHVAHLLTAGEKYADKPVSYTHLTLPTNSLV